MGRRISSIFGSGGCDRSTTSAHSLTRGGHNIDPSIIEEALPQHPSVLYAAAVAKPDRYAGKLPVAYAQFADGMRCTERELKEFIAKQICDRTAVPSEIFLMD